MTACARTAALGPARVRPEQSMAGGMALRSTAGVLLEPVLT